MSSPQPERPAGISTQRASVMVAAGILASRIAGLVRQKVFSFYFGATPAADAFNAAFRIPNLLQNLLGEGVLSASFIPVYARLRAANDDEARQRVAGAVLGTLGLVTAIGVVLGVVAAPVLVDLIAAGFEGPKRELTIQLVRILFPGAGLLVFGAWCLGVLNSHGKFLLSYAVPVVWNAAIIVALLLEGPTTALPRLAVIVAWSSVAGSALQVLLQLPTVHAVLGAWRLSLGRGVSQGRDVYRTFVPAVIGRGVTQFSAYLDAFIASFLIDGSVTILANAQSLYILPVSLFGMAVSAAELPTMAGEAGATADGLVRVRQRVEGGLRRIAFFVVPSAIAFIAIGDVLGGLVFQGGAFGARATQWLWATMAAAAVGLLAATLGRLYASTLYALGDARTPQRCAIVRVSLNAALGFGGALWLAPRLQLDARSNVVLLALASGCAAWLEYSLLHRAVMRRVGAVGLPMRRLVTLMACAGAAAGAAWGVKLWMPGANSLIGQLAICTVFAAVYGLLAVVAGVPEARAVIDRLRRRRSTGG